MSERSNQFEWDFLEQVLKLAGYSGYEEFSRSVMERLSKGEQEYGRNTFFHKPLAREVMEEALDIAGWGTLWVEQINWYENEHRLNSDVSQNIKLLIAEAGAHAVRAYVLCRGANDLLTENLR